VNENNGFNALISKASNGIVEYCKLYGISFLHDKSSFSDSYAKMYIQQNDVLLKIDFINDVAAQFGGFYQHPEFGLIDSVRNILSNKITALFRYEPKDIADIWIIAKHYAFDWNAIFAEACEKELGLDRIVAAEIIQSFPAEHLEYIKWMYAIDKNSVKHELEIIVNDILSGKPNSLYKL